MPRNYVRKIPNRTHVSEEKVIEAKNLIALGRSVRFAAKAIGIKYSSLRRRLSSNKVPISLGRFKPTFTKDQEAQFTVHCQHMDSMFLGITTSAFRRLAYEFAEANNIEHRFDNKAKMAGRDWTSGFLKRNNYLDFRPSGTDFDRQKVNTFYKTLKDLYDEYNFRPDRLYNMDELCLSTVPGKAPKTDRIVAAERGTLVTAMICMSATGHFVPPAFVYPLNEPRPDLLNGGPDQSICICSDDGIVNPEHFHSWLQHFKSFVHPSREDPVLLIIDNQSCHVSLAATKYAREHDIVILTLPTHASHKIQPLDVAVNNHLKMYFVKECETWMNENPGQEMNLYQVASLFNAAYKNVASVYFAESGFKETGVYPFEKDLFHDDDFAQTSDKSTISEEH